jgi:hypothetical protein
VLTAPDNFSCVFDYVHSIGYNVHHYIHFNQEVKMASKNTPDGYWTYEKIVEYANTFKTNKELRLANPGVCCTANKKYPGLLKSIFGSSKIEWDEEKIRAIVQTCPSRTEFARKHSRGYALAKKLGILDEIFNYDANRWDKESIHKKAVLCSSKSDFKGKYHSAYVSCITKFPGYIDELFENKIIYWTEEMAKEVAVQYEYKGDLALHNPAAYDVLKSRYKHILNGVLKNRSRYGDRKVIYLWQANSLNAYKIGVTSSFKKDQRIIQVKRASKFEVNLIRLANVGDATCLEKQLLKIGKPVQFDKKFDGSTEFRHLTDDELNQVLAMIDAATTQQEQAA